MASDPVIPPESAGSLVSEEEHLNWLVANRSRNQQATLNLYLLLKKHEDHINSDPVLSFELLELAGIAFSLWRAVFLSEPNENPNSQIIDVSTFLSKLISNNSIGYVQDIQARTWTFSYYLGDAKLRLRAMASRPPHLIEFDEVEIDTPSSYKEWEIAEGALEKAADRFGELAAQPRGLAQSSLG